MKDKKNFILFGAGGFIAPRHLKAIRETENSLIAAIDKKDSVGIMDSYFPESEFFLELEELAYFLEKKRSDGLSIEYSSICTPNYLHAPQIAWSLKNEMDVICEKPLVMHPNDLDFLSQLEKSTGKKVNNILQLRYHDSIRSLKKSTQANPAEKRASIQLTYITSRGSWYLSSWKNDYQKSGGVMTNIGIHFFDMLMWIFGPPEKLTIHLREDRKASGSMYLRNADIVWFLSIDENDLPEEVRQKGQRTFREINIDGNEMEFSAGFTDLHTITYSEILNGNGFGIDDARGSIELVEKLNQLNISRDGETHPMVKKQ